VRNRGRRRFGATRAPVCHLAKRLAKPRRRASSEGVASVVQQRVERLAVLALARSIADHGSGRDGDELVLAALGALQGPFMLARMAALSEACERCGSINA